MKKKINLILLIFSLSILSYSTADAHRSGCHRWHSCPSDSGSYVCGDLGYTSGCPVYTKPKPVLPPPKILPPPVPQTPLPQPPPSIQNDTVNALPRSSGSVSGITTSSSNSEDDISLGSSLGIIGAVVGGFGLYVWYKKRKGKSQ